MQPNGTVFCNVERTFEDDDIVLSSQLESFTFPFDRSGSPRGVTPILEAVQVRGLDTFEGWLTGTEYRTFGFGLSVGQFSSISRREDDCMPSPSVFTSDRPRVSNSADEGTWHTNRSSYSHGS